MAQWHIGTWASAATPLYLMAAATPRIGQSNADSAAAPHAAAPHAAAPHAAAPHAAAPHAAAPHAAAPHTAAPRCTSWHRPKQGRLRVPLRPCRAPGPCRCLRPRRAREACRTGAGPGSPGPVQARPHGPRPGPGGLRCSAACRGLRGARLTPGPPSRGLYKCQARPARASINSRPARHGPL
jgi:hypothetical protein